MSLSCKLSSVDWRAKLRPLYKYAMRMPPVVRSLAGLVLIVAGVLGIVLPILGFWMAPLGVRVTRWLDIDVTPMKTDYQEGGG
jgi:hypothetical protein